jgi:hypothetical protein
MATVMYSYRSETESNKDGTMNKVFLVLLWPLFLAPILCHAQEIKLNPNPTASDCRAAQKLLASRLTDDNSISFRELNFVALEMETCMKLTRASATCTATPHTKLKAFREPNFWPSLTATAYMASL